jgi:anti-sigma B factor antagonist
MRRVSPVAPPFRLLGEVPLLQFDTTLSSAGDALIALSGELDLSGAPALDHEIEQLAARPEIRRVVLDLRRLDFLDSSGLRSVALADRRLAGSGRSLVLVRGNESVQRVFEITRMVERLTFVDHPELNGSAG